MKTNCGSIWAGPQACQNRPQFGVQNSCGFGGNPHILFNGNGFVGDSTSLFSGGRKNVLGSGCGGVKRKCAGTGVFLPRRCPEPVESRVKSGNSFYCCKLFFEKLFSIAGVSSNACLVGPE